MTEAKEDNDRIENEKDNPDGREDKNANDGAQEKPWNGSKQLKKEGGGVQPRPAFEAASACADKGTYKQHQDDDTAAEVWA